MSDTIVVMNKGKIQQIGTPEDIYNEPKNAFVADFIGESNILDGVMLRGLSGRVLRPQVPVRGQGLCAQDEPVDVVIRPEDIDIVPPEQGHLCGTVTSVTFKGVHYDTIVDFKGFKWLIQTTDYCPVDAYIGIRLNPEDIHIMHKSEYSGLLRRLLAPTARNMTRLPTPRRKKTMKSNKLLAVPVYRLDDPVYDHPAWHRLLLRADRFDHRSVHAGQSGRDGHVSADLPALDLAEPVRLAHLPGDRLSGGLLHRPVQAAHAAVSGDAHHAAHVHELPAPHARVGRACWRIPVFINNSSCSGSASARCRSSARTALSSSAWCTTTCRI